MQNMFHQRCNMRTLQRTLDNVREKAAREDNRGVPPVIIREGMTSTTTTVGRMNCAKHSRRKRVGLACNFRYPCLRPT